MAARQRRRRPNEEDAEMAAQRWKTPAKLGGCQNGSAAMKTPAKQGYRNGSAAMEYAGQIRRMPKWKRSDEIHRPNKEDAEMAAQQRRCRPT